MIAPNRVGPRNLLAKGLAIGLGIVIGVGGVLALDFWSSLHQKFDFMLGSAGQSDSHLQISVVIDPPRHWNVPLASQFWVPSPWPPSGVKDNPVAAAATNSAATTTMMTAR